MTDTVSPSSYLIIAADLVSAYVGRNSVPASELSGLIRSVHKSVIDLSTSQQPTREAAPLVPAVPIAKSIQRDRIACVECGQRFQSLKRHLRSEHGLGPEEYRAKWHLPKDYPMVAPDYANRRSVLAQSFGLGRKGPRANLELTQGDGEVRNEEPNRGEHDTVASDLQTSTSSDLIPAAHSLDDVDALATG